MIAKVKLSGEYEVTVKNDSDRNETTMGVGGYQLMFCTKQKVVDHIALLNKALEFWEYE